MKKLDIRDNLIYLAMLNQIV